MKIAVVNDIHIGPERPYRGEILKMSRYAKRELEVFLEAVGKEMDIDAVVELGDLIEDESYEQDAARYRSALRDFERIPRPTYHVIGNHEQANLAEDDLRAWLRYDQLYYSFDVAEHTCIALYSEHRTGRQPRVSKSQVEWLGRELDRSRQRVVVFVHHPLAEQSLVGNRWFENLEEECLISNRSQVRDLIEASGKVDAVVNGHAHWFDVTVHNGVPYVTLPSLVEKAHGDVPMSAWTILTIIPGALNVRVAGTEPQDLTLSSLL